jgi:hypothetical protein
MEDLILVHGIAVRVLGNGFEGELSDFHAVCNAIETAAAQLDKIAIEASVWDAEKDDYVNPSDSRLEALSNLICVETLRSLGWVKPHAPSVSVFGLK